MVKPHLPVFSLSGSTRAVFTIVKTIRFSLTFMPAFPAPLSVPRCTSLWNARSVSGKLCGRCSRPHLERFSDGKKFRIFANLSLDDNELKLYERYYEALTVELPNPDLVIYLQAKPEVLLGRIAKKKAHEERQISTEYVQEVARAYEHFFFRYEGADLLVIETSEIDFVEKNEDLQQLLRRLQEPVKGTQYFLPLGGSD